MFFTLMTVLFMGCGSGGDGENLVEGTGSVIALTGQVYGPDDTYLTYVGLFSEVPEGDVSFANFREFGNANVMVYGGRIFVEQDGVVQRFGVTEDLRFIPGPRFTWADFGLTTANAISTVFISATRAYTFAPQIGRIIVWDPTAMERTDVIEFEYPERPENSDTWASDGYLVGDNVIWNVFSGDWGTNQAYPGVTLAIVDADTTEQPTFVTDSRCLPGGPSFVDTNGDYYVHGAGFFGLFYAYGTYETDIHTCALRVNAGETTFDPDYELDYEAVTGTYVNTPWIRVAGDQYITRAWDPANDFPESTDDFWTADMRPLLVDLSEGTSEPYPDIEGLFDIDGVTRIVDGVSYFQVSEEGYVEGGHSEVVRLGVDGTTPQFNLVGGFMLGLERVR